MMTIYLTHEAGNCPWCSGMGCGSCSGTGVRSVPSAHYVCGCGSHDDCRDDLESCPACGCAELRYENERGDEAESWDTANADDILDDRRYGGLPCEP